MAAANNISLPPAGMIADMRKDQLSAENGSLRQEAVEREEILVRQRRQEEQERQEWEEWNRR